MKYELIPIEKIKSLEYVFSHHLKNLQRMILADGYITQPLVVENKHFIVLDGSHKHVILSMEGFKYAPVYLVDYDNPHIRVGSHRQHSFLTDEHPVTLTKEKVLEMGLSKHLFPPRTTRHIFTFKRPELRISLSDLGQRNPIDMSSNIYKVDINEEIKHNKMFVKEIEEEIIAISEYKKQIKRTKKYLEKQINLMEIEHGY